MSWTRVGQLSAETQSLADVAGLGGDGYAVSDTVAYTGSWSYRTSATNAPMGFAGAFGTAARCNMMFRHNGTTGNGPQAPVIGMLVDGASLVWRFDVTNNDVTLTAGYTYDTTTRNLPVTVNVPALADVNTWRNIGMTAYMAASGGFVSLYVDGVQVAEWTGDTQLYRSGETTPRTSITAIYAAGTATAWTGGVAATWSQYAYIDDFYADWWSGESAPTDTPPPTRRFYAVLPTADVTENWTPSAGSDHYALVDDAAPDDDTTYVVATSAGLLNQYAVSGFVLPADYAVRAVIRKCYGKKSDAGADSRVTLSISDGVDTLESETLPLPTAYGYVRNRWETQPDGVSAWDETAVNAVIIGTESAGDF